MLILGPSIGAGAFVVISTFFYLLADLCFRDFLDFTPMLPLELLRELRLRDLDLCKFYADILLSLSY